MSKIDAHKRLTFEGQATYHIRIKGCLDESWSDRLGGMTCCISPHPHHGIVTTLVGRVPDQAALVGALTSLYNLELPILSVEYLNRKEP